jgi:hypothetical protein
MNGNKDSAEVGHAIVKLVLGTIAGFAAGKLTEKAYDQVLGCIRLKRSAK